MSAVIQRSMGVSGSVRSFLPLWLSGHNVRGRSCGSAKHRLVESADIRRARVMLAGSRHCTRPQADISVTRTNTAGRLFCSVRGFPDLLEHWEAIARQRLFRSRPPFRNGAQPVDVASPRPWPAQRAQFDPSFTLPIRGLGVPCASSRTTASFGLVSARTGTADLSNNGV